MAQQFSQADIQRAVAEARRQIATNWGWFLALGIALVLAGVAAIAFPLLPSLAVAIALGWIFMISGVVLIIHAFSSAQWSGFLLGLLLGALYVVAGAWLAFVPLNGIVTLTVLLAALFLAEGVLEVIMGVRVRPHEGWVWLVLSGLVAIAAGMLIAMDLPGSATWALGLIVGINLLTTGMSFIVLALAGKRAGATTAAA